MIVLAHSSIIHQCTNFSNKIFPVAIYHSFKGKPGDVNEYLRSFINELNSLLTYGIKINDKQIHFEVAHIIGDTLAKDYLLQVKIIIAVLVVLTTHVKLKEIILIINFAS